MTCGIYKITRKDTGQMYIGLSENIEKRYCQHANGHHIENSYIDRAMVKHGEDKFDLEIIEELPNDRTLLMKREAYWVDYYNTYENDFHYNLTPGGEFNPMKVPEIAAKMSGRTLSQKTREKLSQAHLEQKLPDKQKISISKALNTSGYYRVYKLNDKSCKQGFVWAYRYYKNGKHKKISSVDIKKLEKKVKAKGLEWIKFDE